MNEQTELLIRELADKLGTTSEHLWGVLVQQAAITGFTNLFVCIVVAVSLLWVIWLVKKKTTISPSQNKRDWPEAEWTDEGAFVAWFAVFVLTVISTVIMSEILHDMVAGLFNPEFWALNHILKSIG